MLEFLIKLLYNEIALDPIVFLRTVPEKIIHKTLENK